MHKEMQILKLLFADGFVRLASNKSEYILDFILMKYECRIIK